MNRCAEPIPVGGCSGTTRPRVQRGRPAGVRSISDSLRPSGIPTSTGRTGVPPRSRARSNNGSARRRSERQPAIDPARPIHRDDDLAFTPPTRRRDSPTVGPSDEPGVLSDQFRRWLLSYARMLDVERAEDAVQEAFAALLARQQRPGRQSPRVPGSGGSAPSGSETPVAVSAAGQSAALRLGSRPGPGDRPSPGASAGLSGAPLRSRPDDRRHRRTSRTEREHRALVPDQGPRPARGDPGGLTVNDSAHASLENRLRDHYRHLREQPPVTSDGDRPRAPRVLALPASRWHRRWVARTSPSGTASASRFKPTSGPRPAPAPAEHPSTRPRRRPSSGRRRRCPKPSARILRPALRRVPRPMRSRAR